MLDDVKERLKSLGFTVAEADNWVIEFCCEKVTSHIKNNCNVSAIPEGLREVAIDLACGEFLRGKFKSGGLDYERAVKRIKEGDTDVEFVAGLSDAELVNALIADLRGREIDFAAHRRMRW